jgi:Ca-activated chloride channel family protein
MRGAQITLVSLYLGASTFGGGCVRYYAGQGYGSTWRGTTQVSSQTTVQASLHTAGAEPVVAVPASGAGSDVIVVDEGWSPIRGWGDGMGTGAGMGTVSGMGADSAPAFARVAAHGGGGVGLGGLVGGGVPVSGGLARLDALGPLGGGVLEGGVTLYADAHVSVRAALAHDALPATGGQTSVVLEVTGLAPPATIAPLRVHLVIDASTSMRGGWDDVKEAALAVVDRLRPQDELQIVVYGTTASEALPPVAVADGRRARGVIRGLTCGGRTNIESGLRLAYGALRPAGRSLVVVISDGVPQGGLSAADELGALAAQAHAEAGAVTLAIGLGTEFHTGILSALGAMGGGDFRIAPRAGELRALLEAELTRRRAIVASGLEAVVVPAAGVTLGADATLALGAVVAGQARTFVVPVTTSHAGTLVNVRVQLTDVRGRPLALEAALSLSPGAMAVPQGAMGAVLDAMLAEALRAAGQRIENGDGEGAASLLRANAEQARSVLAVRPIPALAARVEATERVADVLPGLVAEASWGERRRVGAAFVEWSFGLAPPG